MKTKYSNNRKLVASAAASVQIMVPAIPFDWVADEHLSKDKYVSFKLRSDPTSANSPTYELAVRFFSNGTPEEWLLYLKAVEQVLMGQNIMNGPHRYAMHH